MKTNNRLVFATVFLLSIATSANAALYSRLNGDAVYDSVLNITWLADANYASTSGYTGAGSGSIPAPGGWLSWEGANIWAASLTVDGISGWRLPATIQPDPTCSNQESGGISYGYNCTGSEMGELFYNELGGVAGQSIDTTHNANYYLFKNFTNIFYYSGTEWQPQTHDGAWGFYFDNATSYTFAGLQGIGGQDSAIYHAMAVHDGNIGAVPIPSAFWLFGSGMVSLFGIFRRGAESSSYF